jgi:Uma2 family endonuclease
MARTSFVPDHSSPRSLVLSVQCLGLTDEQFHQLCQENRDLQFELTAQGELLIMTPTGTKTGWRNAKLTQRVANWTEKNDTGVSFDSSTGFTLPNGAKRSPDAAWVRRERWDSLSEDQQEAFAPLCPDFVVELRSPDDSISALQDKMSEYMENGAQLGWLLDPGNRQAYVYRPGKPVACLENPETVSGDPVLPGFVFNPREIW